MFSTAMLCSWSIFCLFLFGWPSCLSLFLAFCLSFLIFLILSSSSCSFFSSSSTSILFSLVSLSPSLVPSLGRAHLLYSLLELSIWWFLFSCIKTASWICLSNALLWNFSALIRNFTSPGCFPSCLSKICLSMWLPGLSWSQSP